MTGLIVAVSLLAAHVTGFIEVIAPPLGAIGTVMTTIDHGVAETVTIKNYIKTRHATHKKVAKK